jgi:hypothetical protein
LDKNSIYLDFKVLFCSNSTSRKYFKLKLGNGQYMTWVLFFSPNFSNSYNAWILNFYNYKCIMVKWRAEFGSELENSCCNYCWVPGLGVWDSGWSRRRGHFRPYAKPRRWLRHKIRRCSLQMYASFTLFLTWTRFIRCTRNDVCVGSILRNRFIF